MGNGCSSEPGRTARGWLQPIARVLRYFDITYTIKYNTIMGSPAVVIDTNIIISAQRSMHGASARLVSLIGTGLFDIHVSIPLVLEYEEILARYQSSLGLNQSDILDLVDALCHLAIRHKRIQFSWRPYLRDPKDEFILDLAVKARCDYIVTFNEKDFAGAEKFGIEVCGPKAFLQTIGVIS